MNAQPISLGPFDPTDEVVVVDDDTGRNIARYQLRGLFLNEKTGRRELKMKVKEREACWDPIP